jgi:hypothetical protein
MRNYIVHSSDPGTHEAAHSITVKARNADHARRLAMETSQDYSAESVVEKAEKVYLMLPLKRVAEKMYEIDFADISENTAKVIINGKATKAESVFGTYDEQIKVYLGNS